MARECFYRSLVLLVLMKLINQLATFNYALFNANIYQFVNDTCQYKSPPVFDANPDIVMRCMFSYSYLGAAIGGLLSSAFANRGFVLTVGGWVMTIGCACVGIVRALGLACNRAAYVLAWLFHPLCHSLLLACLLAAFADCGSRHGGLRRPPAGRRTLALTVYYVSASSTIWFNMFVWPLVNRDMASGSHEFVAVGATVFGLVFVVAGSGLPHRQVAFEMPTMRRLLRYFQIFAAFILFITQLNDGHLVAYQREALDYMNVNATEPADRAVVDAFRRWNVPRMVNIAAMLAAAACQVGLSVAKLAPPFQRRLLSGVGISVGASACALVCSLAMQASGRAAVPPTAAAVAFSVCAFAEGVAEILTMVAAYELLDDIAPPSHKDLLVGIALSVWNSATILRNGINFVLLKTLRDSHLSHCTTHAVGLALTAVCLAYTRFVSLPLASTILQTPADSEDGSLAADREGEDEEAEELLSHHAHVPQPPLEAARNEERQSLLSFPIVSSSTFPIVNRTHRA